MGRSLHGIELVQTGSNYSIHPTTTLLPLSERGSRLELHLKHDVVVPSGPDWDLFTFEHLPTQGIDPDRDPAVGLAAGALPPPRVVALFRISTEPLGSTEQVTAGAVDHRRAHSTLIVRLPGPPGPSTLGAGEHAPVEGPIYSGHVLGCVGSHLAIDGREDVSLALFPEGELERPARRGTTACHHGPRSLRRDAFRNRLGSIGLYSVLL